MTLILASASSSRKALLKAAGIAFQAQPANVDEAAIKAQWRGAPAELAVALANKKAQTIAARAPKDALVLGADQLLICQGRVFDKARTVSEARRNFEFLRGKQQSLMSGVALWRNGTRLWDAQSQANITLRDFSDQLLARYIKTERAWLTKVVGGCRYEGPALQLVERVDGDYWSILGLPLLLLMPQLRRYGILEN